MGTKKTKKNNKIEKKNIKMKYLVCFDGSQESHNAVHYVEKFAKKTGDDKDIIVIFSAYYRTYKSPQFEPGGLAPAYTPPSDGWLKEEKRRILAIAKHCAKIAIDQLKAAGFDEANIQPCLVEVDEIREAVMQTLEKEKIDAVVVGSRGHGVLKRAFLGSLSNYLAHHAAIPVIIAEGLKSEHTPPAAAPQENK